jgi:hypothetical protein
MAAPTVPLKNSPVFTTPPTGQPMNEGYQTRMINSLALNAPLWPKTVQPPGMDGGEAIDVATMWNTVWRPMRPSTLLTLTEAVLVCAYDPDCVMQLLNILNREATITIKYPNFARYSFFGYYRTFEIAAHTRGAQPEATVTVQATNWDPVGNVEAGPSYAGSGSP